MIAGALAFSVVRALSRTLGRGRRQVNITSAGERRVPLEWLDFYHRQRSLFGVDSLAYHPSKSAPGEETHGPCKRFAGVLASPAS